MFSSGIRRLGAAFQIAGDPKVINLQAGDIPTQHAFGRNAAGELIHYYWSPQPGWAAENLTHYGNIGAAFQIADEPEVINLQHPWLKGALEQVVRLSKSPAGA